MDKRTYLNFQLKKLDNAILREIKRMKLKFGKYKTSKRLKKLKNRRAVIYEKLIKDFCG